MLNTIGLASMLSRWYKRLCPDNFSSSSRGASHLISAENIISTGSFSNVSLVKFHVLCVKFITLYPRASSLLHTTGVFYG